jgi:hypothetical protein
VHVISRRNAILAGAIAAVPLWMLVKSNIQPRWELMHFGDEPAQVSVRGEPKTLALYLHSWSSTLDEAPLATGLNVLTDCVIVAPNFGGMNNHPQGAGHSAQLERIDRCRVALLAKFPMIERTLIFGQSGGGYTGLMYMAAYPGTVYGASLWVFPYDLADWWQQKTQFRASLEACMGGTPAQVPAEYLARSPMSKTIAGVVLHLNGSDEDVQVPFSHQEAARDRFATGNTVTFRNFAGGHITQWPEAAAQLQAMYPT